MTRGRSARGCARCASPSGRTARRIVLGAQLRRLREAAGISRADAGYTIRGSESKISRLELGRVGFKERDVADLLTMYGVDRRRASASRSSSMVRHVNEPGWWHRFTDLMPDWFQDFVGLEEAASRIQTYELQFVARPAADRGLRAGDREPRPARAREPPTWSAGSRCGCSGRRSSPARARRGCGR